MGDSEVAHDVLPALVENHRAFLRYLERRVGDRALAEDILQDAFAKLLARPDQAPTGDALVPRRAKRAKKILSTSQGAFTGSQEAKLLGWFYRTLRNAAIDRFRRQGSADRALEAFARELETAETVAPETHEAVCQCISRLATTLKPDYADALQAIEVDGQPVKAYADTKGLTAANAAVRVFRARQALKRRVIESCGTCAEHGCLNCTCQGTSTAASATVEGV